MVTEELIQKLEALYQSLLTKDATPDEEAEAKAKLLEIFSSIKAYAEMQGGEIAQNLVYQTNALKDLLLAWDPYAAPWFKEEKTLVDGVYNILASAKTLTIQKSSGADGSAISALKQQVDEITSSFSAQIANLQNEIASIKKSIIALATAMKNKFESQSKPVEPAQSSIPVVEQKPVSLRTPVPLVEAPISPKPVPREKSKKATPKPVSIPKPIPIPLESANVEPSLRPFQNDKQKPISIPKPNELQGTRSKPSSKPRASQTSRPEPRPIPLEEIPGPTPIPLSGEDFEEPIPLDEPEAGEPPLFGTLRSSSKEPKKKPDKEQLFKLFSSSPTGATENREVEIVKDTTKERSRTNRLSIAPQEAPTTTESRDPETLYQELISLEGKRYSIERSIRDLKTDRENGVLTDQEYKEKISQLLDKLQTISKRIEEIRKKLD